ncbi:MAG: hypothetical protein ACRETO_04555 [Gammaproteobacteria bacterium]
MKRSAIESRIALKRASTRQWVLKPQDLAVALKLVCLKGGWLPYAELGEALYLSRFEAHAAVQRLGAAGLVAEVGAHPEPVLAALREFVLHGARYAFPPVRGERTIGCPTAHATAPLKQLMMASADSIPVWPYSKGKTRGQALLPLYEKLPQAALEDAAFYELLALFDALRAGQARERGLAAKLLEERLR